MRALDVHISIFNWLYHTILTQICPSFLAIFCDYYNPPDECEWHYKPCGSACMKTCKNPSGDCSSQIPPLEGTSLHVVVCNSAIQAEYVACVIQSLCFAFPDRKRVAETVMLVTMRNISVKQVVIQNAPLSSQYLTRTKWSVLKRVTAAAIFRTWATLRTVKQCQQQETAIHGRQS